MQTRQSASGIPAQNMLLLLALAPILAIIIPWDFGTENTTYRVVMAGYSLTVPIIQLIIYFRLCSREQNPFLQLGALPKTDQIAMALLLVTVLYSTLFVSIFKFAAVVGALVFYAQIAFTLLLFQTMGRIDQTVWENFWKLLGLSTFAYAALWAVDYYFYPPSYTDWIQRVPGVTNVRWTGFFWLAAFAAGLVFVRKAGPKAILPAWIYGIFGLTMTIWTGSRGALLAIICAAVGALVFGKLFRKPVLIYCIVTFVVAIGVNTLLPVPNQQYGLDRILNKTIPERMVTRPDTGRIELWQSTAKLSGNQPLFGHGIDQFQRMGPEKTLGYKGPHSWPMQMLFSMGLVGILVFVYGIARFVMKFEFRVEKPHELAAVTFVSGGLAYMLYDNFLYYSFPIAVFTVSILMLSRSRQKVSESVADAIAEPAE